LGFFQGALLGTPLSVWHCARCDSYECIGSLDELKNKPDLRGLVEPLDLHRPFVDDITFHCGKCGAEMKRQPEVIDCWFDSGAMPLAQWHYPFQNKDIFERCFPAIISVRLLTRRVAGSIPCMLYPLCFREALF